MVKLQELPITRECETTTLVRTAAGDDCIYGVFAGNVHDERGRLVDNRTQWIVSDMVDMVVQNQEEGGRGVEWEGEVQKLLFWCNST